MSDSNTPPTVNSERLMAVAGRLQNAVLALPRFRPADVAAASDFDKVLADLLQTMVEASQAAAVDQASIAVAMNLIERGNQSLAAQSQLRADVMAKMAERAVTFPISKGA